MRSAWLIARKDLRQRLRDRSAFIVGLAAPFGLAVVFSLILGGADAPFQPTFAVVDLDGGPVAAALTADVLPQLAAEGLLELETAASRAAVEEAIEADEISAAFILPAGLSEAVQRGRPATIEVVGDVDSGFSTQIAAAIAEGFGDEVGAVQLAVATAAGGGAPADPLAMAQRAIGEPDPVGFGRIEAATRELDLSTFFVAGMAVFFLFFTVQYGVASLLEEQHDGTMSRLLAAPIGRLSIIGGKAITSFVLGLLSMVTLIIASALLLGAQWGNPLGVLMLVVAGVSAAVAIMAVVATVAKTAEQAGNYQSIIAVILGMLGGVFFPVSQATGILAALARITPHFWFLRGLGDLAGGAGLTEILPSVGAILLFAVVAGGLAALRLRRVVAT